MVQLEYCCKSKLFAPSDDNLTLQRYNFFGSWNKKAKDFFI